MNNRQTLLAKVKALESEYGKKITAEYTEAINAYFDEAELVYEAKAQETDQRKIFDRKDILVGYAILIVIHTVVSLFSAYGFDWLGFDLNIFGFNVVRKISAAVFTWASFLFICFGLMQGFIKTIAQYINPTVSVDTFDFITDFKTTADTWKRLQIASSIFLLLLFSLIACAFLNL